MTITDVQLVSDKGNTGDQGTGYTTVYQVYLTGAYSAAALLNNSDGRLPKRLDLRSDDLRVYAQNIEVDLAPDEAPSTPDTNPIIATYTVTWALKSLTFDPDPLLRPAQIEWGGTDITETTRTDSTGAPIINSAGELYTPLPVRPIRGGECQITRNEKDNPANTCVLYSYTTNSAAIWGVSINNALFGKITGRKVTEVNNLGLPITYWEVTYPIRFRRDGWALKLIDNGFSIKSGSTRQQITDAHGQQPQVPQLLDGAGHQLAVGGTPVVYPTAGYPIEEAMDWTALHLPNPFA